MEVVSKSPEKIVVRMPANESLANAIRRSVAEVPTLAIDEVEIYKNDSALYDEIVAHRLGLVPMKTEKGMNDKTSVDLKLSVTGPCTVYASDLTGDVSVVHDKMPITILGEGHKLELVAKARLGKGIEHAKYTPGLCFYRHLIEVKSSAEIDKIIQKSKSTFKSEKKGSKWICDLPDADVEQITNVDGDAVSDSDEMLIIVESYGSMDAKDIFTKAIEALTDNLEEFEKAIK